MSKTMTTLAKLRQNYQGEGLHCQHTQSTEAEYQQQEEQQQHEGIAVMESRDKLINHDLTPLPFHETSVGIVEFHPEELTDFSPLKPEEADEMQLARILQGDDLSFLEEIRIDSYLNIPSVPQPKPITAHRIPSECNGERRNDWK